MLQDRNGTSGEPDDLYDPELQSLLVEADQRLTLDPIIIQEVDGG